MSARRQLVAIPGERRDQARRRLGVLASRRLPPASALALIDAAADALAEGRVGAAHDLVCCVCSPARAERVLLELLGPCEVGPAPTSEEATA